MFLISILWLQQKPEAKTRRDQPRPADLCRDGPDDGGPGEGAWGLDQGQVHRPHPDWSIRDWHLVIIIYFWCGVSCFWEMGGVLSIAGYDQWPWPRSRSLIAFRLVVTRSTPGNHYLFLMWCVLFVGNRRWFFLLLDLINGLAQGQDHRSHSDWSLRDRHLVIIMEIGGGFFVAGFDQWPCPTRSISLIAFRLVDTRLTPSKHCLFLLWGVLFLGNGRSFVHCWIWSVALANKVKFINHIQIGCYEIDTW